MSFAFAFFAGCCVLSESLETATSADSGTVSPLEMVIVNKNVPSGDGNTGCGRRRGEVGGGSFFTGRARFLGGGRGGGMVDDTCLETSLAAYVRVRPRRLERIVMSGDR